MLKIRKYKLKKFTVNLSVFIVTLIILLILSEISLRIIENINEGSIIQFPNVIRPSKDQQLYFELVPNIKNQKFHETKISINSEGYRDKEYSIEKPDNTIRIVALGDSVGFGWGVNLEDVYTEVLEKELNKNLDKNYEVLNFAVPGFYTAQELRMLESKAIKYSPDIILVIYLFNDAEVKSFHEYDKLTFIYRQLNFFMKRMSYLHYSLSTVFAETRAKLNEREILGQPEKTYIDLLEAMFSENSEGWNLSKWSLIEIDKLAKGSDSELIVVIFPDIQDLKNYKYENIHKIILNFCKENNLNCMDLLESYKYYADTPMGTGPEKKDAHPDALGHKIMADGIYKNLIDDNLI